MKNSKYALSAAEEARIAKRSSRPGKYDPVYVFCKFVGVFLFAAVFIDIPLTAFAMRFFGHSVIEVFDKFLIFLLAIPTTLGFAGIFFFEDILKFFF